MTKGCSIGHGGGERPATYLTASPREQRRTFAPGRSTHTRTPSLPHPSPAQPAVDSWRRLARGVTGSGGLRRSTSRQSCAARETASMVRCGSPPAVLRKWDGYRMPRASKGAHGKRGPTHRHGLALRKRGPSGRGERGSDARGRARASLMLLQKSTDSGRRREADALHLTRFGSVQGRAPSPQLHVRKHALRAKRHWHPHRDGNLHVTVSESGCDPRMAREAGDGSHPGPWSKAALHGTPALHGLGSPGGILTPRVSEVGATGERQGCQRSVVPGVGGRRRRLSNPELPAEADRAS
jgi:hypothetical protein